MEVGYNQSHHHYHYGIHRTRDRFYRHASTADFRDERRSAIQEDG